MISWCEDEFYHERIALAQELGHEWCQPREVEVEKVDAAVAPYRERFLSFGLRYVLIIPVVLNDELKGILLLGSDKSSETHGSKIQRCIDLAAPCQWRRAPHGRIAHFDTPRRAIPGAWHQPFPQREYWHRHVSRRWCQR